MTVFKNVTSFYSSDNNGVQQSRIFNGCFIIENAIKVCVLYALHGLEKIRVEMFSYAATPSSLENATRIAFDIFNKNKVKKILNRKAFGLNSSIDKEFNCLLESNTKQHS